MQLHGDGSTLVCTGCRERTPTLTANLETLPPVCASCQDVLRPDVVLFGEMLPEEEVRRAEELVKACGCLLVVGTSCEVYPAAFYPDMARTCGATLIEVNPAETSLTRRADVSLPGTAGDILPRLFGEID